MKKFNIYILEDKFWFRGALSKSGIEDAIRFTLVWGKLWCPNFVQVRVIVFLKA